MDRRTFLATTGTALSTPLGGCLSGAAADRTSSPERPWQPSDPIRNPNGTHHLFVENHTDTTEPAWLRVVRADGATLVDDRYELPDRRGFKFESIAAWETTYTIDLAIGGEDSTALEWDTEACGSGSEAPGTSGSRNAAVRVTAASDADDHQISLVIDQCDALHSPSVPTGSAEAFRLDE